MSSLAEILPEPADGTTVAVYDGRTWVVNWRADSAALPEHPDERWLCDWSDDPVRWSVVLQDALQVYALGELLGEVKPDDSPPSSAVRSDDEEPF